MVDVQPCDPSVGCILDRLANKRPANTLAAMLTMDTGVEYESMLPAVPGNVDETHQSAVFVRADVQQAPGKDAAE